MQKHFLWPLLNIFERFGGGWLRVSWTHTGLGFGRVATLGMEPKPAEPQESARGFLLVSAIRERLRDAAAASELRSWPHALRFCNYWLPSPAGTPVTGKCALPGEPAPGSSRELTWGFPWVWISEAGLSVEATNISLLTF